jgi:outer membrane protein with beta-barrel domain
MVTSSWYATRGWDRWFVRCVFVLTLAAVAPPTAAAAQPQTRQGWLIGLGLGGGSAGISADGNSSDREGGVAASLRAGYAFNPRVSLELGASAWTKEENNATLTFSATGPVLNYYPGAEGLVLRAGVGVGTGEASLQSGNTTITASETGLGVMGGMGYEFRVTPRFALGPQIYAGWIDLDSFNANWVNFELGFHWYFIRR